MRKQKKLIYFVSGITALVLLILSSIPHFLDLDNPLLTFLADISFECGIVVFSIMLIDFLWGLAGGEPLAAQISSLKGLYDLQRDSERTGLVRVYAEAQETSLFEWERLIRDSKFHIDIAAESAFEFAERANLLEALADRMAHGVKVRILLNSPRNLRAKDWFVCFEEPDAKGMHNRMNQAWHEFQSIYNALSPDQSWDFQVVRANKGGRFRVGMRRFDDRMYIIHYLFSLRAQNTPTYIIDGSDSPLFKTYLHDFEALLNHFVKHGAETLGMSNDVVSGN